MNYFQWLDRLDDESAWGKEGYELGQAYRSGAPIVPGFAVSSALYRDFFAIVSVRRQIEAHCKDLVLADSHRFADAAKEIRQIILKEPFSKEMRLQLQGFLKLLKDRLVRGEDAGLELTVRTEDGSAYACSFSGAVKTAGDLEKLIKRAFAATFSEQALFERYHYDTTIVVPNFPLLVQSVQQCEYSGTAAATDEERHDDTTITIRSIHGTTSGLQDEDIYRIDRKTLLLLSQTHARHWWSENGGKYVSPTHQGKDAKTLSPEQASQLARLVRSAQNGFDDTRGFSWQYAHRQFWITGIAQQTVVSVPEKNDLPHPLAVGLPGSSGWASGPVRKIINRQDRDKVKAGDVVVVEQATTQDYDWLIGAAALVCENGTAASVEAQLANHLGIPAVLGAGDALAHLSNGQIVTVDGSYGAVYAGAYKKNDHAKPAYATTLPITGTKIYATVLDPHAVGKADLVAADGIGLLRSEFILRLIGVHPEEIIRRKLHHEYVEILADELAEAMRLVYPRPVIYQLHDIGHMDVLGFRERHHDRFEPNPAIGYRGTHRLLNEPDVLDLELGALAEVAHRGLTNFSIMLPMARTIDEVRAMRQRIDQSALSPMYTPRLWVKCETPAMAILAEQLCLEGIDGVCVDVPSLAQLTLGIDKANMQMAHHLDQTDLALEEAVRYVAATCRAHGVPSMLVAELDDLRPEIIQAGIESGITAISVAPQRLVETHGLLASIERRIMLDALTADCEPEGLN